MIPQLIVFDLAGTTVDGADRVPYFLQKALATYQVTIPFEDANELMGLPKPIAIRQLLERYASFELITDELIDKIHQQFVQDMTDYYQTNPNVKEMNGTSETFLLLKRHNVKIVVDTGFDRQITNAIIDRLSWKTKDLIDNSVTSDEVTNGRPFPDMIYRAMQLTHVSDSKLVAKVGDTASDMQQGASANCGWIIGVTTGAYTVDELQKEPHTHLINSLTELKNIFSIS